MKKTLKRFLLVALSVLMLSGILPAASAAGTASVTSTLGKIKVDATSNYTADCYVIDGVDYFKLRDLAVILNGTAHAFSITNAGNKTLAINTGRNYQPVGGELKVNTGVKATAVSKAYAITVDGVAKTISSYMIKGNNCVSIDEFSDLLEFVAIKNTQTGVWALGTYGDTNVVIPGVLKFGDFDTVDKPELEPMKCFDNLYFMGTGNVGCFVIPTSDGIIMLDSMNTTDDFLNIVEPSMKKVGLDPADIKILLITHGHGDHIGFSKYLQDTYGTKVYLSEIDTIMAKANYAAAVAGNGRTPVPVANDITYLHDGDVIALGGESITAYWTPGHTRGCFSYIIPVKDNGTSHLLVCWGGTGIFNDLPAYAKSASRMAQICRDRNVDIVLSVHPFCDYSLSRMYKLSSRGAGDPNPMIQGEDTVQLFLLGCGQAAKFLYASGASYNQEAVVMKVPYLDGWVVPTAA